MTGGHVEDRLARIDAALTRIERAAQSSLGKRRAVEARHARLRTAIGGALEQLDSLIDGQKP